MSKARSLWVALLAAVLVVPAGVAAAGVRPAADAARRAPNPPGVTAVPGAPTITGVTAGDASATVSFVAPSSDGGGAIASYTATCTSTNGGATGTQSGSTSPLVVTGLTNGSSYTCTVTATNAIGTGPVSAPSGTFVPAAVPGAPTVTSVTPWNTEGLVSFSAPASNGGSTIASYTATCTSTNGGAIGTQSGSTSPLVVTGLTNGSSYTCTVTATNAIGTGPASAPSGTFVPAAVPGAPTITSVDPQLTSAGVTDVSIAVNAPASNGGDAITGYTATCTSSDGGVTGAASGATSPLAVAGLTAGHFYTCTVTATNVMGTGPASAPSASFGPPGTPTITEIIPAPTQATVVFSAPAATNGSAITGYTATCASSDGGVTGEASGAASPLVVAGLSTATTYTCAVTATNGSGTGPSIPSEAFVAQTPDYLFALSSSGLAVCPDPTTLQGAQQGCLDGFAPSGNIGNQVPVTDGVNVYWATMYEFGKGPGWSCPIVGGTGCTTVFTGPTNSSSFVTSLAVANGEFFFGQTDGSIWRCPANVPWENGDPTPGGCVELDDAGNRQADQLIVANGRLYAGLNVAYNGGKATSIIWSCSLTDINHCTNLDNSGYNPINVLEVGAGYLWAGLDNGILWRCDLNTVNDCATWDTFSGSINGLSYDGQGTVYAYVTGSPSRVWTCPTGTKNACNWVESGESPDGDWGDVAAGAGSVFWTSCDSTGHATLSFGYPLVWTSANTGCGSISTHLLYMPAGGPASPGAATVTVPLSDALAARCERGGAVEARVRVRGPHGFSWRRTVDLCQARRAGVPRLDWGELDAGGYDVSAEAAGYSARATMTVSDGARAEATVTLART